MKNRAIITVLIVVIVGFTAVTAETSAITIEAESAITAGDPWEVFLEVDGAGAGDDVQVTLLNGLRVFNETLQLGSGGVAVWRFAEGEIMQAGTSRYMVQHDEEIIQRTLRVRPGEPTFTELFSTANALPAYGEGNANILILPQDAFGNAPAEHEPFDLRVQYPDGERATIPFIYSGGLGRVDYRSVGMPGRVRMSMGNAALMATLEVFQTPGEPAAVELALLPDCVLADGRDVVSMVAEVADREGFAVADGTLVAFRWEEGVGSGRTIDGQATLRLPAPVDAGRYTYRATSGAAESATVDLRVTEGVCTGAD